MLGKCSAAGGTENWHTGSVMSCIEISSDLFLLSQFLIVNWSRCWTASPFCVISIPWETIKFLPGWDFLLCQMNSHSEDFVFIHSEHLEEYCRGHEYAHLCGTAIISSWRNGDALQECSHNGKYLPQSGFDKVPVKILSTRTKNSEKAL